MAADTLKERTAKGLFWGGLSNTLQQLLGLCFGLLLARMLMPEDYSMVAMLMVYSLVASCIQESGFGTVLAIRKEVTHRDFNAVFWFNSLVSLVLYGLLFIAAPYIAAYNRTPELTPLARVAFLGFVFSALGTAHFAYLFRHMMVKQRTIATFTATVFSGLVGVAFVYNGFAYWGLVFQDLCYKALTAAFFWYFSDFRPSLRIDLRPIRSMFGFSSKLLVTNILNNVNNQYLQAVLGHYYPRHDVGNYSQANKWNTMGYSLVGGMVNSIAQPVLAGVSDDQGRQVRIFRKMLRFTAMFSFPAMLGLAVVAPEFVVLGLKEQWAGSVPYLQVLCIAGAFIPVAQLYSNLLISKGRSGAYMCSIGAMLLLQLLATFWLSAYGIRFLIYVIAALNIVWLAVWHLLAARFTGLRWLDAARDVLPFFFIAVAVVVSTDTASRFLVDGLWARLGVKVLLVACTYAGILWALRVVVFRECLVFLRQKLFHK